MSYTEHKKDSIHRNYTITYNKREKAWHLKRRGLVVFSGTEEGVRHWYENVILPNNPMF